MGISAKIIADSISDAGDRITTFELEYPRFIHAELMTHRLFSRNAASSRAIPIEKMMEQVNHNPAMPVQWGLNKAGMQAEDVHSHPATCVYSWKRAAQKAVQCARELQELGLHKQIVNRVLEPFQTMKTIITATEYDNFFWLRSHADAQPEIKVLSDLMYEQYSDSEPELLKAGEWHLPYVHTIRDALGNVMYLTKPYVPLTKDDPNYNKTRLLPAISLEEAQKISASCCAQVSYRRLDDSLDKALKIYDQLVSMSPVHASPFEHQATPIPDKNNWEYSHYWNAREVPKGVIERRVGLTQEEYWSGNLKGWIQYRQLIDNNTCWDYGGE